MGDVIEIHLRAPKGEELAAATVETAFNRIIAAAEGVGYSVEQISRGVEEEKNRSQMFLRLSGGATDGEVTKAQADGLAEMASKNHTLRGSVCGYVDESSSEPIFTIALGPKGPAGQRGVWHGRPAKPDTWTKPRT